CDRDTPDRSVVDDLHRIATDSLRRHDHRGGLFTIDDVDFDRHADPQWRVSGQQQIHAEGFSRRVALWRDLRNGGSQRLRREGLAAQESLLTDRYPGDFLFVDFSHHLHRRRRAYPEQHVGRSHDLTDLAVAAQHHAVQGCAEHERIDAGFLRADPRLGLIELVRPLLVFRLRSVILVAIAPGAIEIACDLFIVAFQLMQRVDFLGVVLAGKDLTSLDGLPLAAAEFDHPPPLQRYHLGPTL